MLEEIRSLLFREDIADATILLVYDMMVQYAKNYCGISIVCEAMQPILCAMTVNYLSKLGMDEKRVTRGDTNIEYFSEQEKNQFALDFHNQLNLFRKVRFGASQSN